MAKLLLLLVMIMMLLLLGRANNIGELSSSAVIEARDNERVEETNLEGALSFVRSLFFLFISRLL